MREDHFSVSGLIAGDAAQLADQILIRDAVKPEPVNSGFEIFPRDRQQFRDGGQVFVESRIEACHLWNAWKLLTKFFNQRDLARQVGGVEFHRLIKLLQHLAGDELMLDQLQPTMHDAMPDPDDFAIPEPRAQQFAELICCGGNDRPPEWVCLLFLRQDPCTDHSAGLTDALDLTPEQLRWWIRRCKRGKLDAR